MRFLLLLICAILFRTTSTAQGPSPCGTPAMMTPTCQTACVICNIDGFTGRNDNPINGVVPPGFCTSSTQNAQWIAFIAGSTSLRIEVDCSNCVNNQGIQLGLYKGANCTDFQRISNCINPLSPGQTATFVTNQVLVIGQYYWLIMDGRDGDVCDYKVRVVQGTTLVPQLTTAPVVVGPSIICSNEVNTFRIVAPVGSSDFAWTVNGLPMGGNADTLALTIPAAGQYNVCAIAKNACDIAPQGCAVVTVVPPASTTVDTFFCASRCLSLEDTSICNAGSYTFLRQTVFGCDSVITYKLTEVDAVVSPVKLNICAGDTLLVGPFPYTQTGQYVRTLPTAIDCDSTIQLDLTVVVCQMKAEASVTPARCKNDKNGELAVRVTAGTPPFSYNWQRLGANPPVTGTGVIAATQTPDIVSGLGAGLYAVTVSDGFGNFTYFTEDVTQPDSLIVSTQISDYQGYGISCFGSNNGQVRLQITGGNGGYTALWSNGSTSNSNIDSLVSGLYTVTISDEKGCTISTSRTISAPEALSFQIAALDPDCTSDTSGSITIIAGDGGVPPYTYTLQGDTSVNLSFTDLSPSLYTITQTDGNGCTQTSNTSLAAPAIPFVALPDTATIILGDSIRISASLNQYAEQLLWSPTQGLSCIDCANTYARPFRETWYTLTATSAQGCVRSDSMRIRVIAQYDIYIPNVFQPDESPQNGRFTIYGGPEVTRIQSFEVFSRWGEPMYRRTDMQPNDEAIGWDGQFRGKKMPPGVYAYQALVEFLDGKVETYTGTVTLVR
jgi:gliding motility-associated-like protein